VKIYLARIISFNAVILLLTGLFFSSSYSINNNNSQSKNNHYSKKSDVSVFLFSFLEEEDDDESVNELLPFIESVNYFFTYSLNGTNHTNDVKVAYNLHAKQKVPIWIKIRHIII